MRKLVLVAVMVLALAGTAFGTSLTGDVNTNTNTNANTNLNTNANTSVNANTNTNLNTTVNTFIPTNLNSNIQGQMQGQQQGQMQGQGQKQGQKQNMNNKQTIAPQQEVSFTSPTPLLGLPSQYVPQLNFGSGKMEDVTRNLPAFALYGITPLGRGDRILGVLKVNANVKFKNLYEAILDDGASVASKAGKSTYLRYQVVRADSQKTWTTGGNIGGGGSGLGAGGMGGGAGAGSIIPQIGRTKADDLYTIIFVKIAE